MTAMRLAKRIYSLINKNEDKKISSLLIEGEQSDLQPQGCSPLIDCLIIYLIIYLITYLITDPKKPSKIKACETHRS